MVMAMNVNVPEVDVSQLPADDAPAPYILDVREDDEWMAGHIETAEHIRLTEVPGRLAEIPTDRRVYVVCRSGSRSSKATAFLAQQGVDAVNVAGGMQAWHSAGRPMAGPADRQPEVL